MKMEAAANVWGIGTGQGGGARGPSTDSPYLNQGIDYAHHITTCPASPLPDFQNFLQP